MDNLYLYSNIIVRHSLLVLFSIDLYISDEKNSVNTEIKEDNEEYKFDEDAFNKVSSIVKNIWKKDLLDFKNILIENENKSNKYFEQNKYLKDLRKLIISFFRFLNISEYITSFTTFHEILRYIMKHNIYTEVFGLKH